MARTREELEGEVLSTAKNIFKLFHQAQLPFFVQNELTMAQLKAFALIADKGPMVIGQLAQDLGIGQSTAGHLVDKLVKAGLVQRSEDVEDRRRTVVHATDAGQELFSRFRGNVDQLCVLLKELSEQDLCALHQGFNALEQVTRKRQELRATYPDD